MPPFKHDRHARQHRRCQSVFERVKKTRQNKDYQCGGSVDAEAGLFNSMTSTLSPK
jgi:hypothetical protein